MIKKSIYVCLVLFFINVLVRDVYKPHIILSQSQWQDNQIKAQNYLYTDTIEFENIIVGSSMSKGIIPDSLDCLNFCNLAFAGESPREGLELIIKKGIFPKNIFIEINKILKPEDSDFANVLYNPILYPLRKEIPTLRDGKQPLPLLVALAEANIMNRLIPERLSFFHNIRVDQEQNNYVRNIKTRILSEEEKRIQMKAFSTLQQYIQILKENNVTIIFFEMPSDIVDCNSDLPPDYKDAICKNYPPDKYLYMPNPECNLYKTGDGVHLMREDMIRYTSYFKTQADSLIHTTK